MITIKKQINKRTKRIIIATTLVVATLSTAGTGYALYKINTNKPANVPVVAKVSKPATQPAHHTTPPPTVQTPPPATPTPPPAPAPVAQATTPPPAPKPAPVTACTNNTRGKLLLISISSQHIWACEAGSLVREDAVTTGMTQAPNNVDDATPTGLWTIDSKQTNQRLRGSDINGSWDDFVQYWIPFDGPIGFHDASWQTIPFGSQLYKTQGSHGCVHLPIGMMAWVYNWSTVGTTFVKITG